MRIFLLFVAAIILAGCSATTAGSKEKLVYVVMQTEPDAATVSFADGTSCVTPCRIGVRGPLEFTVARTGYHAYRSTLTPQVQSPLTISLQRVVEDTELETMSLPDLQ